MDKRKILVLTTIYPSSDLKMTNTTNVVHYFTREWVKMGYDVRVVFNYPIYLRCLHWIAMIFKNVLASKFNTSVTVSYTNKDKIFEIEGVKVYRLPLFKPLPHGKVSNRTLKNQVKKIHSYLEEEKFVPDVIVAHNFYPHIPMVNDLQNRFYKYAKTAIVVHKQRMEMLDYILNKEEQLDKIDIWGYRSLPLKKEFEAVIGKSKKNFMCYSGIPKSFLYKNVERSFNIPLNNYIYVGSFIKRKHVDKIVQALYEVGLPFHLDLVGDGANKLNIQRQVVKYNLSNSVSLNGYIPRASIPCFLKKAECFIMISEQETFGLVYLEAMSMGCITIASQNEGMDGIIKNGINGFLCKAGDSEDLVKTINKINRLSKEEINNISQNAKITAESLTDDKVAHHYAKSLFL